MIVFPVYSVLKVVLFTYLVIVNVVAFVMMAVDKSFAKRGTKRIPEALLLFCAFIGGTLGELLGMYIIRHKTRHVKFVVLVPLFLVIHVVLIKIFIF
ncbi:MAG: DUF1294 domain-containing protein [Clostridiales bacterium]|nr:DUF1294 domain-containing protein [Clostridiales bacterium]